MGLVAVRGNVRNGQAIALEKGAQSMGPPTRGIGEQRRSNTCSGGLIYVDEQETMFLGNQHPPRPAENSMSPATKSGLAKGRKRFPWMLKGGSAAVRTVILKDNTPG